MKQWTRVSLILVIAICAVGAGMVAITRAAASTGGGSTTSHVDCQVHFLDGPNQGLTEPVGFSMTSSGGLTASASEYVGGVSGPGSWQYTDTTEQTVFFTFTASLVSPPSTTLTVTTTIADSTTTVVGTSQGTITDSSGTVLGVAHTTTTCPDFLPPPPCNGLMCGDSLPPAYRVVL